MAIIISMTLTFLSLLVVGQASDPTCEELIKPLDMEGNYSSVIGKWVLVEGVTNSSFFANILKSFQSSWMESVPTPEEHTYSLSQAFMLNGKCDFHTINITLKERYYSVAQDITSHGDFLQSCANCLTMHFTNEKNNTTFNTVYLFTKNSKPSDSDMDIYWKQVECLGLSKEPQFSYDGVTELCEVNKNSPPEETKPEHKHDE